MQKKIMYANPSYKITPHCTIKPRACYCFKDDHLKICEVKDYNKSCVGVIA